MPSYRIESPMDDWNIWSATIDASELDDAIVKGLCAVPEAFRNIRSSISNLTTYETVHVLTWMCPECSTPVLEESEEWMLTDLLGVYQHVDCYHPERTKEPHKSI